MKCPTCKRDVAVTRSGKFRRHAYDLHRYPGQRSLPNQCPMSGRVAVDSGAGENISQQPQQLRNRGKTTHNSRSTPRCECGYKLRGSAQCTGCGRVYEW